MTDGDDRVEMSAGNRVQMRDIVPMGCVGDKTARIKSMLGKLMTVWQLDRALR
jgi:hypothetical protein